MNTKKNIEYTLSTFEGEGLKPSEYAVRIYEIYIGIRDERKFVGRQTHAIQCYR